MRITTRSSIDISESFASFLLGSYIYRHYGDDARFERRMKHVKTAKYTIADVYWPEKDTAFEVKSRKHGTSALKGCIQASIYKEQVDKSVLCIQKPRRQQLAQNLKRFCDMMGVGVLFYDAVPNISDSDTIEEVAGGEPNPFRVWRASHYTKTRDKIIARSTSENIKDYMLTLEQIIEEKSDEIFEFCVEPDPEAPGFKDMI